MRVHLLGECMNVSFRCREKQTVRWWPTNRCPSRRPSAVHVASFNHVRSWSWLHAENKRCSVIEQEWFCFAVKVMWLSWWEWGRLSSVQLMTMIQWMNDHFMMRIKPSAQEFLSLVVFWPYLFLLQSALSFLLGFLHFSLSCGWLSYWFSGLNWPFWVSLVTAGQKTKSKARLCRSRSVCWLCRDGESV